MLAATLASDRFNRFSIGNNRFCVASVALAAERIGFAFPPGRVDRFPKESAHVVVVLYCV